MSGRRLLVTGAQGFVGRVLTETVRARYVDLFDLVDFIDPATETRADIRDADAVARSIAHARPDAIIHLAAIAAPREAQKDPTLAWSVNVMGTLNIATAIRTANLKTRLIWSGSSETYGNAFNRHAGPIREDVALEPMSSYGATKAAADIMLRQMAGDGLDVILFRPFNHTGPGQTPDYVVPAFAEQIAKIEAGRQEPVLNVGNLEALRDFLDVTDVAEAYLGAARMDALPSGSTYNIATGKPISIDEILRRLLSKSTMDIAVNVDPDRYFPNKVETASGSPQAIERDIGWTAKIAIDDTLQAVLDSQRARFRD